MNPQIKDIEYIVPSLDKPLGSISFGVTVPIFHKPEQGEMAEADAKDVILSEESVVLMNQLSASIIKDLEK